MSVDLRNMFRRLTIAAFLIPSVGALDAAIAGASFSIEDLPKGKSVTLPHQSRSVMELPGQLRLRATDHNQTVKFYSHHRSGNKRPIKLSLYDSKSAEVRHVTLKATSPVIYHLNAHQSLRVRAEVLAGVSADASNSMMSLVLESNRPLELTRSSFLTK